MQLSDFLARGRARRVALASIGALCVAAATATAAHAAGSSAARAAPTCSASGLSTLLPAQELPRAVASVRRRIVAAAVACDYARLERIARERDGFSHSFGGSRSPAAYWRMLETSTRERPLARLVRILRLPVTRNEARAYAWPSAYTALPTPADWSALVRGGVYTRAQVDRMRRDPTGYLGWRTGITRTGDWQFFVAGD